MVGWYIKELCDPELLGKYGLESEDPETLRKNRRSGTRTCPQKQGKTHQIPKIQVFHKKKRSIQGGPYDPYESGVVTLLVGLITPLTTSRGPPSRALRINDVIPLFLSCFLFMFVDFSGFPENSPGFASSNKNMIQKKMCSKKLPRYGYGCHPKSIESFFAVLGVEAPNLWDYRLEWLGISKNMVKRCPKMMFWKKR